MGVKTTIDEATLVSEELAHKRPIVDIMVGEDPGPVDGFLGPQSFAAMDVFAEEDLVMTRKTAAPGANETLIKVSLASAGRGNK